MLREQIDHDLLDAVLDDLAKWPMNVATTAAGALRSGLGSASYGHARASSGWLAVEDSCPDAWYSLAAELEKLQPEAGGLHERLDLLFGATVAAARDMKTLVFAQVLSWRQEEMAHRRQFRHRHLQSDDVTDFG